jgi:hypothetical protein
VQKIYERNLARIVRSSVDMRAKIVAIVRSGNLVFDPAQRKLQAELIQRLWDNPPEPLQKRIFKWPERFQHARAPHSFHHRAPVADGHGGCAELRFLSENVIQQLLPPAPEKAWFGKYGGRNL